MRPIAIAFALVLVGGASAHAEGPLVVRAGLGITANRVGSGIPRDESETRFGPGLHIDIAYRLMRQLATGVHVGLVRTWQRDLYEPGNIPDSGGWRWNEVYTSFQLGVGAQWAVRRFSLAPWIGIDDRGVHSTDVSTNPALSATIGAGLGRRQLAFGLGADADLYINPTGHRLGAYLDVARGQHSVEHRGYGRIWHSDLYISIGIAYRYW